MLSMFAIVLTGTFSITHEAEAATTVADDALLSPVAVLADTAAGSGKLS